MPCLHTESLSSLPAEGQYGDTSAPKMSQRSRSNSGRKGKSGEKGARGERKDSIKEQSVITSAGWVFSPLWISGAKTQRLGFRMGMESERVKAWLDDHSDSARCYFNRSSRQWVNSCLEKAFQSPRNEPKSKMAVLGRRRVSHPVCGPSRKLVHPATLERPHSCLSVHQYDDCATLDKCGGHSPKPPGATCLPLLPRSPQASCLSRSQCFSQPVCSPRSPRLVRECRRGESCDFMMKLFGGEVGHLQSKDIHLQMLLHLCEIIEAQSCSLSMTTMDKTGGKSLGPVLQTAEESVHGHTQTEWEKCIMGYVVSTGRPLNIRNAHEDPRFQCKVDDKADDRLKSILTVPILNHKREVIGVFMAGNKRSPGTRTSSFFSEQDEKVLSSHMALFGLILENSQLSESSEQENRRNQVLLALAQVVSQDFPSVDTMLKKMAAIILPVAKAQICVVFISDDSSTGSFSSVAHIEYKETSHAVQCTIRDCDTKDISFMYAAHVQNSQETLNITNVITDQRLNRPGQTAEDSHMRSLICTPMRGKQRGTVIGLCQLVNKRKMSLTDTEVFSRADELLLEDFAVYCALGLHKLNTRQTVEKTSAKLAVTKEVLSYQISAPQDEIEALEESVIPSAESLCLLDFSFSDCNLSQTTTTQAVVRMFIDLNLLHDFNIDYKSLCQWVLSVQKGYRSDVVYHNWSHALSTAQCMFAMLNATDELKNNLSSLEVLALMIASLSHDLDHRGVNNSYIERSNQPLAQLYGHSSLEHHHYDMCLLILNNPGSQILSSLSLKEYRACVQMIERNILATDLAVYIEKRTKFFELSENGCCLWKYEEHRELLRSMLMTASDICAITKPWPVQKRIAERVATEFFAQGDREKCEFNIQPIDVMDRENSTRLPHMQVEYIDGICSPLYEALASIFASCSPLIEGCKRNRNNWQKLVDSGGDEEEENKIKGKDEEQYI